MRSEHLQAIVIRRLLLLGCRPSPLKMALLLGAKQLAQGAFGVAPVTFNFLKSVRGLASTTTGAAAAAAQPLPAEEAAPEAVSHTDAADRWKPELGVIRTDWT